MTRHQGESNELFIRLLMDSLNKKEGEKEEGKRGGGTEIKWNGGQKKAGGFHVAHTDMQHVLKQAEVLDCKKTLQSDHEGKHLRGCLHAAFKKITFKRDTRRKKALYHICLAISRQYV